MVHHSTIRTYRHSPLAVLVLLIIVSCVGRVAQEPARWTTCELDFTSSQDYDNPFWDVAVQAEFTAPSGSRHLVDAFWDDGRAWRVRFAPDEVGQWTWESSCSDTLNEGLHGHAGSFRCIPYTGENPLYRHGPIKLSKNRRHLVHADGTPFFWLSCTAWNGVLRANPEDWEHYLRTRQEQNFTAIQFVSTHWRGLTTDHYGETAFTGTETIRLNPVFFQRMDHKVAAINEHGIVATPVILWTLTETDPGQILSEADAIRLARYIVARWGAYSVVWFLGGDGRYPPERVDRWKRIGRAVFGDRHDRLVTLHPSGENWVGDDFADEPWFDFIGYQSGHGDSRESLRWLTAGPPATEWQTGPPRPVINLEPNYENHPGYTHKTWFQGAHVRRATYWSLLVSPPAGVSFGHNSIWVWPEKPQVPDGHAGLGTVGPWREGLHTEGVRSMTLLRQLFESLPWPDLSPAPNLLAEQPGNDNPSHFIAAAQTQDRTTTVVYAPEGATITLRVGRIARPASTRWFNPRDGKFREPMELASSGSQTFESPNFRDWVLVITRERP
ncbi:MAG: DUF4038 domain-containing protein [Fidelibacterota bacterium]|nr:MAG: DUF4038 domain-containing protein [Candidatus Neomarinimicrobiota bacterium]